MSLKLLDDSLEPFAVLAAMSLSGRIRDRSEVTFGFNWDISSAESSLISRT